MLSTQESLYKKLNSVILRFPIPALYAILIYITLLLVEYKAIPEGYPNFTSQIIYSLSIGYYASLGLKLFSENRRISKKYYILSTLCIFAVTMYFYNNPDRSTAHLFELGAILLMPVLPYFFNNTPTSDCSHFTLIIIRNTLLGILYSIIIVGCAAAIVSISSDLFDIKVSTKVYTIIGFTVLFIFFPYYTASNTPREFIFKDKEPPKDILFFLSRILPPVLLVCFLIFNIYYITTLINKTSPKKFVALLISIVGVIGIFTHLFLSQLENKKNMFSKIFLLYLDNTYNCPIYCFI